MTNPTPSLYDRIGGKEKLNQMIQAFYQRILTDLDLAPFFAKADIPKLVSMQQEFFSIALDGPVDYSSRQIVAAHHGRGIKRQHFTKFCEHLLSTLVDNGISHEDADKVLVRVGMYAGSVTGSGSVDG